MEVRQKAEKLFKSVKTFIISCVDENGYPMTKAVVPSLHRKGLGEIYFYTNTSSKFAQAISKNPKSSVYFYSKKFIFVWKGCYLQGTMEVVEDPKIKEKYWNKLYKNAYEEKSWTDPDFCLLRFTAKHGRFYSSFKPESFEIESKGVE